MVFPEAVALVQGAATVCPESGMLLTVICAVPAVASCEPFSRTRVTIEASQFTVFVGVQYAAVMGIVNTLLGAMACGVWLLPGGVNVIVVVFKIFFASRNISCKMPPAAIVVG